MEISLSELRDLMVSKSTPLPDRNYGWIVLIIRNGFVFVGDTKREAGVGLLKGFQVRFWSQRAGGLPEFAAKGRVESDKLDAIDGEFEFLWTDVNVLGVLPCGNHWKK